MTANVREITSAGLALAFYGVLNGDGILAGSTTEEPAAGNQVGSGMQELLAPKNFPFTPQEPERNTVTGGDRPVAQFLYQPIELPNFNMEFGMADYAFEALVTSMLVHDLGDMSIVASQPDGIDYVDIIIMVMSQAYTRNGISHWDGLIAPRLSVFPLGRNTFQERTEGLYQYSVVANKATVYPWGAPLVTGLTTSSAPALHFTSPNRKLLWRWTGDGIEDQFTLPVAPVTEDVNGCTVWVNGTILDYTTDYTVDNEALTLDFESGSIPGDGDPIVAMIAF